MKTMLAAAAGSLVLATALADDVSGSERLLCS
jgi:hypothetical protein